MKKWFRYNNHDPLTLHGVKFRAVIMGEKEDGIIMKLKEVEKK